MIDIAICHRHGQTFLFFEIPQKFEFTKKYFLTENNHKHNKHREYQKKKDDKTFKPI